MGLSFCLVDNKVAEVEFFLNRMADCHIDTFSFNCYLSAFLSASRTTTLSLQRFKFVPGFNEWYEPHRRRLSDNKLARYFLELRNRHVHGGEYPVGSGQFVEGKSYYYFSKDNNKSDSEVPSEDVLKAAREYFILLLLIVYDCYDKLGSKIDPQRYYSRENFEALGLDIEYAEIQVYGWVSTSLIEDGFDEDDRWRELRSHVGECEINHLFYSYLGKTTPRPIEPEHYADFEFTPEEMGWDHTPAGFSSVEDYFKEMQGILDSFAEAIKS